MSLVIVGNNDGPLTLLRALKSVSHELLAIGLQKPISNELRRAYRELLPAEVSLWEGFGELELLDYLRDLSPSLLINCFCNFRFKLLLHQPYEVLNVHLAPLPRYRGRHPLQWALINGEQTFGLAVHRMVAAIDSGDILWRTQLPIIRGMSARELRTALMGQLERGFGTFYQNYLAGKLKSLHYEKDDATYIPRRHATDALLTEWHDRDMIYRKVMALRHDAHPAQLVYKFYHLPIAEARLTGQRYAAVIAPMVVRRLERGVRVVCLDGRTVDLLGFDPAAYGVRMNERVGSKEAASHRLQASSPHM